MFNKPTFEFVLRNEKRKFYDRFAVFVCIINVAAIIYFLATAPQGIITRNSLILAALLLIIIAVYFFSPLASRKELTILVAAANIAFYWIWVGYWWLGLTLMILFFLYRVSKRELRVKVGVDTIIYPSFPEKLIHWKDLSNIILKDGLLTIDFRNNRIIQQLIEQGISTANEEEFNEFCKKQLSK